MADMRECSGNPSHTFDVEQHSRCPVCNAPPKPIGELHMLKKMLPWIVTVMSVILAIFAFTHNTGSGDSDVLKKYYEIQKKYEMLNKEKEDSESAYKNFKKKYEDTEKAYDSYKKKYAELEKNYGYGSNKFYSSVPILVLNTKGNTGKISIYSKDSKIGSFEKISNTLGDLEIKWNDKWNNEWIDLLVTPHTNYGYGIIRFTRKEDNTMFDVLVVVK